MKAIAHIYAKDDGTFDIASSMQPRDLAQVLLALTSAVVKMIAEPQQGTAELTDVGPDQPSTVTLTDRDIGPGERIEGIDGASAHPAG